MSRNDHRSPLDLYVNKMINGVPHLARTRDISKGGVYLHRLLEPRTPAGAHLAVEFMLPGSEEIIWAETEMIHGDMGEGLGLRFLGLTPRHSRLIQHYIEAA